MLPQILAHTVAFFLPMFVGLIVVVFAFVSAVHACKLFSWLGQSRYLGFAQDLVDVVAVQSLHLIKELIQAFDDLATA